MIISLIDYWEQLLKISPNEKFAFGFMKRYEESEWYENHFLSQPTNALMNEVS
jgi:hypothetical protein